MIFEHGMIFKRYAYCRGGYSHGFDRASQRALFLEGLSRGAALISPDELSYFRSGCELDSQEEHDIYYGLSGFVTSAVLLAEHRLFGTYHGLNFIKEASLQIAVSTIHVVHDLVKTLFSTIKLGLSLLFMTCTLGLSSIARDMVMVSIQATLTNIMKTCVAAVLWITGILGALLTRPLSTLFNPVVNSIDNADISEEEVNTSMKEIGCDDSARVRNSIFWLRDSNRSKRGTGSRLERVVGSLSDIVNEAAVLSSTEIPYNCDCDRLGSPLFGS